MAQYEGMREKDRCYVFRDELELSPQYSIAVWSHSPDGFQWGYGGSGPAQLALALLLEETGREEAVHFHQLFKRSFVVAWKGDSWRLTSDDIHAWLSLQRQGGCIIV